MDSKRIRRIYNRRARYYNAFVRIASFGRDALYRRLAVDRLKLEKGDTVLDLGCGTGLNFPLIRSRIGPGRIVGVDISRGMLERARLQAERDGDERVRLVQGSVGGISFPPGRFDAVIATYLLTTVSEYESAIHDLFETLRPGGRLVLSDDILPAGWFAGPGIMLSGLVRRGYVNFRREIIRLLSDRLDDVEVTRHHCGLIFIVSGVKRDA